jgi:hypothetical protein
MPHDPIDPPQEQGADTQQEQDLQPGEERALRAVAAHGPEAEIDADTGRALTRRGLAFESGTPEEPIFMATGAGHTLVEEWEEEQEQAYMAGRVIVQHVLVEDHPGGWTRAELLAQVTGIPQVIVAAELGRLTDAGVVAVDGERVQASPCARYLDNLNLIGV